ncbi:MAG: thiopeptide-type bacteriocin biosynthesis protein [Tenuifilaceae bacterium]|jgi:thiopeptide-type bacteriocin biosynthesis protein|nr:thiopeptide-type bacteriocin biosynthesis protein [Tenuifilaceae bacterium]
MKRKFIIGDEWLYFKIYCGPKTADKILVQVIKPLTNVFLSKGIIDKWFFIRYADPKYHLRIRLHLNNTESIVIIINEMNKIMKPLVDMYVVDSVLIDTYSRELERYGSSSIEVSEDLFFFDSKMVIDFIDIFRENEGDDIRWLFALRAIDALLEDFGFADSKKLELLHSLKEEFGKEFSMNKSLKLQLDRKYRSNMNKIANVFNSKHNALEINFIVDLLKNRSEKSKHVVQDFISRENLNTIERSLQELLPSFIHMMINRLFRSKQRKHELVIYYFLFKYYTSKIANINGKPQLHMVLDV